MNNDQRAAILAELEQYVPLPNLRPGEITANDIASQYGMTRNRAIRWARVMVADGRLEEFKRYDQRINKVVNAWRPVSGLCAAGDGEQHIGRTDDIPY